ncbi:LOW QUALITY PROTEIN: uncharacterized protein [Procambarus clarkii]|uniref:LOW QUALITY PROTEIN: uncharacterized protein n=1 Tax=Procambarus clarkii TaxID=6728 RepID=UPI003744B100
MKPAERSDTAAPAVSISKDGCHVSRGGAVVLGFLFVTATVATGLLAYHFSPGTTTVPEPAASDSEVPLRSSYPRQASVVAQGSEEVDIRLPTALKPLHYVVKLQPFINGNFSIVGYVEIEIEVLEPTSNITLHILDIITKNETIKVVPSDDVNGTGIEVQQNLYDNDRQFYTGVLAEELEVGRNYILSMQFLGYLNDELRGFYRSTYTDLDGNARLLASTQFEATDARRAFPCFDEPAMKATFEIFLAREASMSSISNMPKYETFPVEGQEGWEWDHFNTSVPMSTYLVAFVVSDFVHADSNVNDHVLFRVWAREAALQQAAYALQTGPEVLTFYEEYFSILFPLPKQDMIAIPDFSAGAMENWGLITYREEDFLYDPAVSPASSRQRVAIVVAHELAHQWFGNLVTPVWWTDIWLNEGFATFMEYTGTDHIEPSWKMWEQFVSDVVQTVLELDSLESSHPISIPVGRPEEINQIFDDISYSKGSAVIRMMNYFLTETTFRKGITNYLNGQAYSNAEQDDLWRYLTEAAHEDGTLPPDTTVKMIMDTWTLQMGYPVINVQRSADGTVATITQERFLLVKSANSSDTHDYKWWVPLTFTSQDDPNFNNSQAMVWWMKDSEPEITISSLPGKDQWVIFNLQETGYYRVNYDEDNWNLLIQQLNTDHQVIHVINRAQIIDDAMDLAHAGQLSYNTALSVNGYLKAETEYIAWNTAMNNLAYLEVMFTRTGGYGALKRYLLSLLTPLYDAVGFDDNRSDPQLDQYKRVLALSGACSLEYQDCVDNSVSLFQEWMLNPSNNSIVSANLKGTVYCTAIAAGGEEEWNFAWGQYLASNLGSDKATLLSALGCTKQIWILSRYLDMAFTDGSGIRRQDAAAAFSSVSRNDIGRDLAWNYLRDQWQKISNYLVSFTALGDLILTATNEFNTNEEMHELELFKEEHADDLDTAARAIDQAIERTANNIAWMSNNYDVIVQWLDDQGFSSQLAHRPPPPCITVPKGLQGETNTWQFAKADWNLFTLGATRSDLSSLPLPRALFLFHETVFDTSLCSIPRSTSRSTRKSERRSTRLRVWESTPVPEDWLNAIVLPIRKPGSLGTSPTDFRPIAPTSCICKLFERRYEGVPQGSVLSITLFLDALNGLLSSLLSDIFSALYVDDLTLCCRGDDSPLLQWRLQLPIDAMSSWATNHGFKFSTTKSSQAVHLECFGFGRTLSEPVAEPESRASQGSRTDARRRTAAASTIGGPATTPPSSTAGTHGESEGTGAAAGEDEDGGDMKRVSGRLTGAPGTPTGAGRPTDGSTSSGGEATTTGGSRGTEDAAGIPPLDCHTEELDDKKHKMTASEGRKKVNPVAALVLGLLLVGVQGASGSVVASVVAQGSEEVDIRLPTALKPLHYVVKLQPFINGNFSIVGYVEIEIEVLEPTSNITLHILDIITKNETIKVVPSDDVNGTGIEVQQNLYDNDRQFYTGVLAEELEVGRNYILSMQFLGYLNDELVGFYRSTYTDEDGNTRLLASTQFESTDARRAFPCFDEPAMKATFEIFLAREASMSSISNMPKYETFPVEGQEGWEWDHFNTSVPMSTYLVAFVVSDFAHVDSNFNDHVLFRVWAREAAIEQADYAINTGPEVLTFYEEYFSIPFPLPKQDMCAIPAFTGGAMENWGLIIYSESSLLFDPAVSSAHDQQQVVVVISHELAHQWFGNLVTPDWWTDLWLNEGFASFMENVGTNHIEPSWRMWDQFVSNDLQDVLELDSLESSHPISIPVGSPSEIDQIFDDISYSKGSSVIRMMYNFLTESTFRKGITNYLNGQKYSNAEQDDLWRYLTEAAHEDGTLPPDTTVKMIMDTWTLQMGYPVIEVVRSADGTSATLTQERFLLVKSANSSDTHDYKWWVPLTYTSQDDPNFNNTQAMEWMKDSEPEITISSLPGKDQWVIFNLQETGYYRVNYDEDNWNLLIQQLNTDHQVIHVINRAQIIDDAMDLAHAGQLSYNTALSVNGYLKAETEYIAWNTAINNLAYLEMMFTRTGGYGALKRYLLSLLLRCTTLVGFDDNRSDPQLDQYKRVLALSGACSLEYQDCVDNSVSLFQEWMLNPSNNSIVSANLKGTVYCTAIAAGGEEEWNFAWGQYLASNLGSDKATLLSALGCTKQIWILSRYLDMAFSADSGILKRDAPSVFRSIASNDVGRDLAWSYLRDQFEHILDYIGVVSKVGDLVVAATNEFNTNEEKHELELFREEHGEELGGAVQAVDQAIENTANNIAWMDYNYDVIVQWLEDQGFSSQFGR